MDPEQLVRDYCAEWAPLSRAEQCREYYEWVRRGGYRARVEFADEAGDTIIAFVAALTPNGERRLHVVTLGGNPRSVRTTAVRQVGTIALAKGGA